MNSIEEMVEFATLWDMVQNFQLNAEEDSIRWRWTPNGAYKAKSAYLAQLQGTYPSLEGSNIWKAHAEGKHKLFAWLLIQSKILTANKLLARN